MSKGKQNIRCDVHSCKYCNCDENLCKLKEIDVKNQKGTACNCDETICASYKLDKDKYEDN